MLLNKPKHIFLTLLTLLLFGCDCVYETNGIVVDEQGNPISGVEIFSVGKDKSIGNTGETGEFHLYLISGLSCRNHFLNFRKDGFKALDTTLDCCKEHEIILRR